MSAEVTVMNQSLCLDSAIGDQFTDGMLCAYYEGRDSCQVSEENKINGFSFVWVSV